MNISLSEAQVASLLGAADTVYRIIGFAQGYAAESAAKNDEWLSRFSEEDGVIYFPGAKKPPALQSSENGLLEFTEKEISKMPKHFKNIIRVNGHAVHYRKRTNGRYQCSYEIRFARKPYDNPPITASAPTLAEAKAKFIEKLLHYVSANDPIVPIAPILPKANPPIPQTIPQEEKNLDFAFPSNFDEFTAYWFENFHRPKVQEKTYVNNLNLYKRHVRGAFSKYSLREITPKLAKELIQGLPGNGKTADDVRSILNQIFDTAIDHGIIRLNPMRLFVHLQHERKTGVELTREEELRLLDAHKGTAYEIIYAVMLYAGLRPNEYETARVEGDFIVANNSKRKNGKIECKKIPIIEPLRARLPENNELPKRYINLIRANFNRILPDHTLKDLRKTFHTRCVECKVDFFARKKFMGHSLGKLDQTYTGVVEEFLLSEGKKLAQWYTLYPKNYPNN